jgi:membrane carboxypeptidase/penicillin-binding protein PbpC
MFQTAFQPNAFQNDAFQIVITPVEPTKRGGDDAWTKEEQKRYKALQKKLRLAEERRMAAQKADQEARKDFIREQVSPTPKADVVESPQKIVETKQKEIINYDALIANLQRQTEDLFNAVLIRQAKERLEQEIAILEAKRLAEEDDEDGILALFL